MVSQAREGLDFHYGQLENLLHTDAFEAPPENIPKKRQANGVQRGNLSQLLGEGLVLLFCGTQFGQVLSRGMHLHLSFVELRYALFNFLQLTDTPYNCIVACAAG